MSLLTNSPSDRVMAFIDYANVRSVQLAPGHYVDLYSLCHELTGDRKLVAAYVFDARPDDSSAKSHDDLYTRLRMIGFRVIARNSFITASQEQKEVDVAMACEMVVQAMRDNYDVALVVSGDRDFVPAIQHVQSAGKRVEVASFKNSFSYEMKKMCDYYYELDSYPLFAVNTILRSEQDENDDSEEVSDVESS